MGELLFPLNINSKGGWEKVFLSLDWTRVIGLEAEGKEEVLAGGIPHLPHHFLPIIQSRHISTYDVTAWGKSLLSDQCCPLGSVSASLQGDATWWPLVP